MVFKRCRIVSKKLFVDNLSILMLLIFLYLINSIAKLEREIHKPMEEKEKAREQNKNTDSEKSSSAEKVVWWKELLCQNLLSTQTSNSTKQLHLETFLQKVQPHDNYTKNIYMLENNCESQLSWRVLCSVESLARQNPEATIFLLTVTRTLEDDLSNNLTKLLQTLPNIRPLYIDLNDAFKETPLENFDTSKWTSNENFIRPHLSDGVRMALLYKYGGTYSDTDIISMKPVPKLPNVVVMGRDQRLTGYFIKVDKKSQFVSNILNYFANSYRGDRFAFNGPRTVTRIYKKYCSFGGNAKLESCKNITIFPHEAFSSLTFSKVKSIFADISTEEFIQQNFGSSLGVHFSNHMTHKRKVVRGSVFDELATKFCPFSRATNQLVE